jgi:glycosyltransferase involved in cell wall biosynthesis
MPETPSADATVPSICLNMIVRNEAHVVGEVLDAVAPYISYWVIVDTGSDDGTQDVIRRHMNERGIPGELHECEWRNFGYNRTEALEFAWGHGDYVWVIDADDMVHGTLDFRGLTADSYHLRYGADFSYWRRQLFRNGRRWRYEGVVHEYPVCDGPATDVRLEGDYYIDSRRLGGRNQDPKKYERDRDLLLAEVERNPGDARSVFYLAQSCFDAGDPGQALAWYRRRVEMGGWEEEVYYSLFRCAECQAELGEPWQNVQDTYLRAWEARPVRAEPLHAIATYYRTNSRFRLGYLFAERAAGIPLPESDVLFVRSDVYAWRARDEHAICAFWTGRYAESFALCRLLLARSDLPDVERARIAQNRDYSVPELIAAASTYPEGLIALLAAAPRAEAAHAQVTLTVLARGSRAAFARTINSFLRCCVDVDRIGRFVCVDAGLSDEDRRWIAERYPFMEVTRAEGAQVGDAQLFAQMRGLVGGEYWLHLGDDWRFFAPERYVGRSCEVLAAEPGAMQVAFNVNDAAALAERQVADADIRRVPAGGRYVLRASSLGIGGAGSASGAAALKTLSGLARGPSMMRTSLLDLAGTPAQSGHGRATASFDEVLCVRPEPATSPVRVLPAP